MPEPLGVVAGRMHAPRKHRELKAASLTVFRHLEAKILWELEDRQLESLADGSLYSEKSLVNPHMLGESAFETTAAAKLFCGKTHADNLCQLDNRAVSKVRVPSASASASTCTRS